MQHLRKAIIAGCLLLASYGCGVDTKDVLQDMNREGLPQVITIYVYKNEREVTKAYKEFLGNEIKNDPNKDAIRQGWSTWLSDDSCEIHVVKHKSQSDKNNFETYGHELTHCLYGKFHK